MSDFKADTLAAMKKLTNSLLKVEMERSGGAVVPPV
jgi:hypothetical protein